VARIRTRLSEAKTPKEYNLIKRQRDLKCDICLPNRGENASRKPKHGHRKLNKRKKA
jgi:hypothetical protein